MARFVTRRISSGARLVVWGRGFLPAVKERCMTRVLASAALLTGTLAVVGAQQQPIFRGASDIVRVFATVTDRDGRLVTTLTRDDFTVRDEGKPQPIVTFDNSPQPIRLIV